MINLLNRSRASQTGEIYAKFLKMPLLLRVGVVLMTKGFIDIHIPLTHCNKCIGVNLGLTVEVF